jgi:peptide chain release factor subunit 1
MLAEWRGEPVVISFYLDVDGRRYPRPSDYAPHVNALFRAARERALQRGDEAAKRVEEDLNRIADWLAADLDRHVTRGLAAFAGDGHFQAFRLPVAVRDQVAIGARPEITQLCEVLATSGPILVVAVDTQASRMLRVDLDGVHEVPAPVDPVERQADIDVELGSFEHRHEELRRQHIRRVARGVVAEIDQRQVEHVVLSGNHDTLAELTSHLGKQATALVTGWMTLSPSAPERELVSSAEHLVQLERAGHQRAVAEELQGRASEGKSAVAGLAPTLDLLGAAMAQAVIVEEGLEVPGGRCSQCGQLVGEGSTCLRCGARVLLVENVVAEAISDAFLGHVTLEFCEPGQLSDVGHIGAFERPSMAAAD